MSAATDALVLWLADYHLLAGALMAAVLLVLFALRQPAQRMAVEKSTLAALAALAVLCALPGWSLVHLLSADEPAPVVVADIAVPGAAPLPTAIEFDPAHNAIRFPVTPQAAAPLPSPPNSTEPSPSFTWPAWPTTLVSLHATGSLLIVSWLAIGALVVRSVRRGTQPAPAALTQVLQSLVGAAPAPELHTSERIASPVAVGLRRPTIVLPTKFAAERTDLTAVLAHEWAHIAAGDLRTLAASRLLLVLLWPQPLYWLLRRQLRLDQETLADAAAAEVAGRVGYAEQLLGWARTAAPRSPRLAGAVGLWEGPSQLKRRIAALLDERLTILRSASRRWRVGTACGALVAAALLSLVTLQRQSTAASAEVGEETAETDAALAADGDAQRPGVAPETVQARKNALLQNIAKKANVVVGVCVDERGEPLAGAEVFVIHDDGNRPRIAARGKSGDDGIVRLSNVVDVAKLFPNGLPRAGEPSPDDTNLLIFARAAGRATTIGDVSAASLARDGEIVIPELRPAATLRGVVTGPDGQPVAGATVSTLNFARYGVFAASTDENGRYEIGDLPAYGAAERELESEVNGKFSEGHMLRIEHPKFVTKGVVYTEAPGQVDVQLTEAASEPAAGAESVAIFNPANAAALGNAPLERLTLPVTVTGRAVDAEGRPIAGAAIYLASLRGDSTRIAETTTAADGSYAFRDVPLPIAPPRNNRSQATCAFEVFGLAEGRGFAWRPLKWVYPDQPHFADANFIGDNEQPHAFGRDDAIELDLRFSPPKTLGGRLVDDAGQPVAGATLAIRYMSRVPAGGYNSEGDFRVMSPADQCEAFNERAIVPPEFKTQTTDADGRFQFTGLPEKVRFRMDVRADGFPGRSVWAATRDRIMEFDGAPLVYVGEMNLVLRRPKTVPIRVVYDDTGEPAAQVFVNVSNKEAGTWKSSNSAGLVELPLPPGEYEVDLLQRYRTPYLRTEGKLTVGDRVPSEPHTFRLRRAATVVVTVLDVRTNLPLADVDLWKTRILPRPENGRETRETHGYRSWEQETNISHYEEPRTDASGKLTALFEPGLYRIGIASESFPRGYLPVGGSGQEVTCVAGETVELVFQMRKPALDDNAATGTAGLLVAPVGGEVTGWQLTPAAGEPPLETTLKTPPRVGTAGLLARQERAVTEAAGSFNGDGVLTSQSAPPAEDATVATTDAAAPVTPAPQSDVAAGAAEAEAAAGEATETTHTAVGQARFVAVGPDGVVGGPLPPGEAPSLAANAIAVRCLDSADQPLADVALTLYRVQYREARNERIAELQTNAAGEAQFTNLVPAERVALFKQYNASEGFDEDLHRSGFVVVARKTGYATTLFGTTEIQAAVRGYRADVIMPAAQKLSGRVTAPDGSPVANALVSAGSYTSFLPIEGVNVVRTDAEGRYEFADRPPLDDAAARAKRNQLSFYSLAADDAEAAKAQTPRVGEDWEANQITVIHPDYAVTRVYGGNIPGTANVTMLPAAAVTGRVIAHGTDAPIANMLVRAYRIPGIGIAADGRTIRSTVDADSLARSSDSASTRTDAEGRYVLNNLPAGVFDIWAAPDKPTDAGAAHLFNEGAAAVVVPAGAEPTAAPDLVVGPGAVVRVQLIDASTGKPLALPGGGTAQLAIQKASGPRMQDQAAPRVPVSPDGKLEARLPPGTFRLAMFVYSGDKGPGVAGPAYQTSDDIHSVGTTIPAAHGLEVEAQLKVFPMAELEARRAAKQAAFKLAAENPEDRATLAKVVEQFTKLLEKYPDEHEALLFRAHANEKLGKYAAAVADYERILKQYPGDIGGMLYLARLLASCPEAEFRNGPRAVEMSKELINAVHERGWLQDMSQYEVILAAAQAETGDFAAAIATQKRAIDMAADENRAEMQKRLELYESNRPYRR